MRLTYCGHAIAHLNNGAPADVLKRGHVSEHMVEAGRIRDR